MPNDNLVWTVIALFVIGILVNFCDPKHETRSSPNGLRYSLDHNPQDRLT